MKWLLSSHFMHPERQAGARGRNCARWVTAEQRLRTRFAPGHGVLLEVAGDVVVVVVDDVVVVDGAVDDGVVVEEVGDVVVDVVDGDVVVVVVVDGDVVVVVVVDGGAVVVVVEGAGGEGDGDGGVVGSGRSVVVVVDGRAVVVVVDGGAVVVVVDGDGRVDGGAVVDGPGDGRVDDVVVSPRAGPAGPAGVSSGAESEAADEPARMVAQASSWEASERSQLTP
jgi:hypothetical protein